MPPDEDIPEHLNPDTIIAHANAEHVRVRTRLTECLAAKEALDKEIKQLRADEKKWGRLVRSARGRGAPRDPESAHVEAPLSLVPPVEGGGPITSAAPAGDYFPPSIDD